jgi:hypothetical protein
MVLGPCTHSTRHVALRDEPTRHVRTRAAAEASPSRPRRLRLSMWAAS